MTFTVEVNTGQAGRTLDEILAILQNPAPLMRAIGEDLKDETWQNFQAQGRPHWVPPLAPATVKARQKKGGGKGATVLQILQDSGILAKSLSTDTGPDYAEIGSNVPYAAIHQFGGMAGRGRKVAIPARPWLPFAGPPESAQLQPEAERTVLDTISRMLNGR
ncbi:MAG: phage virion morphogenesis protein [Betaproteobacteria bacterium]|nr:phage virion morphogenesis protein [Betaproteobacteria bacterium]MCL2886532.1 phage virion morphogenesis protein [Betaproteobacteria bacterium]